MFDFGDEDRRTVKNVEDGVVGFCPARSEDKLAFTTAEKASNGFFSVRDNCFGADAGRMERRRVAERAGDGKIKDV